ncbi:MAG TPA: hypothetical protein VN844_00405 [Pyrinomonadaceae bacterium]|nr:hypothetical protein [Pyrinomonadaceae bacterium]
MKRQSSHKKRRVIGVGALVPIALIVLCVSSSRVLAQWTQPDANGNINSTNIGNVGVGTTTPAAKLDVQGGSINTSGGLCLSGDCRTSWSQVITSQWTTVGTNINYPGGNVGIGVSGTPTRKFEVLGGNIFHQWSTSANSEYGFYTSLNNNHITSNLYFDGQWKMIGSGKGAMLTVGPQSGWAFGVWADNTSRTANTASSLTGLLSLTMGGSLGLGTTTPSFKLDVQGGSINSSGGLCIAGDCKTAWNQIGGSQWTTSGTTINYGAGNVGVGVASPTSKLDVNGTVNATALSVNGTPLVSSQWATSGTTINYSTGNVGIGVASPTSKLDVNGTVNATGLSVNGTPLVSSQWATSGTTINYSTGNVGIGVASPTSKLHVNGTVEATGLSVNGTPLVSSQWTTSGTTVNYGAGNVGIGVASPTSKLDVNGTVNATGLSVNGTPLVSSQWATSGTTINYGAGNVGVGVASPTSKLDVNGTVNATGLSVNGNPLVSSQWTTSGTTVNYATGNVGIATASPTEKLHVTGNVKVSGNIDVGGNINAKYQDMAEWVESSQELAPATVVVLDSAKSNQVIASTQSYDSRVAGVISVQPGIALGEAGEGRVLVATTGRVKVKVDAGNGPINIGDLLVTSDKEGVAMKSVPVEIGGVRIHRPGTLIGKALEPLERGSGEILVLLSLQ